jgi:hypothetical protein
MPRVVRSPEWTTITELVNSNRYYGASMWSLSALGRARSLRQAHAVAVAREGSAPHIRGRNEALEHLSLGVNGTPQAIAQLLSTWSRTRAWPNLKRLDLVSYDNILLETFNELIESRLCRKLTDLGFRERLVPLLTRIAPRLAEGLRIGPTLHSLTDKATARFDHQSRALALTLSGVIDMRGLARALESAQLKSLTVEASQVAWNAARQSEWRGALSNVALNVVRV